jgi:hypothetical protein
MSYQTSIVKILSKFGQSNGTANPDSKHNAGRLLGEAFMWDQVEKFAKARSDAAWLSLAREGIIPQRKEMEPGEHELAYSPSFVAIGRVSAPVRRFSGDELAKLLRASKYKVPESATKELIDKAKVPTTSMVSMRIIERD